MATVSLWASTTSSSSTVQPRTRTPALVSRCKARLLTRHPLNVGLKRTSSRRRKKCFSHPRPNSRPATARTWRTTSRRPRLSRPPTRSTRTAWRSSSPLRSWRTSTRPTGICPDEPDDKVAEAVAVARPHAPLSAATTRTCTWPARASSTFVRVWTSCANSCSKPTHWRGRPTRSVRRSTSRLDSLSHFKFRLKTSLLSTR